MLSIQEAGTEILTGNPRKMYCMTGQEYGVKSKYIQVLGEKYGKIIEHESVKAVLNLMNSKHIIPLEPAVYIVRYDEDFISSLSAATKPLIDSTKIIGTLVCIYQEPKHAAKLDKWIPDYTVSIDAISEKYIEGYLKQDYPQLDDRIIKFASRTGEDYNQAKGICGLINNLTLEQVRSCSDSQLYSIFGKPFIATEAYIKVGIASRSFPYLVSVLDEYASEYDDKDLSQFLFTILSTMVELDKVLTTSRNSDLKEFKSRWTVQDIYNMFMQTYDQLEKLRTISSNVYESLIYLFGLLCFDKIPSKEMMI